MYTLVLLVHSWLRYVALLAGIAATIAAVVDRSETLREGRADMWSLVLTIVLDVQMLLGLVLYLALSPFTTEAMRDFGAAMKNPALRFFAVEHVTLMVAAVILAHLGRVLARKAKTPDAKRMRMLICSGLATLLMLLGIPWPGMANGRPLFRL
jgi:heme A synthase